MDIAANLGPPAQAKLLQDHGYVALHSPLADMQKRGNFLVRQTQRHKLGNIKLAACQHGAMGGIPDHARLLHVDPGTARGAEFARPAINRQFNRVQQIYISLCALDVMSSVVCQIIIAKSNRSVGIGHTHFLRRLRFGVRADPSQQQDPAQHDESWNFLFICG